jgi:hypothetical protein
MNTIDAYSKIALTVIAACLVYMVVRDLTIVPPARAQMEQSVTDVNIVQIAGSAVTAPGNSRFEASLPVTVLDR